jgi:hypothetical protein
VGPVVDGWTKTLSRISGIKMQVRFERTGRTKIGGAVETIRVFDSAHGFNEMHRHTQAGGKQTGMRFHSGTLGEGMRAAIEDVQNGYRQMIEGWEG